MKVINLKQSIKLPQLYRNLEEKEVSTVRDAYQQFADCYLLSTLDALSKTNEGRKIISQNIQRTEKTNWIETAFPNFISNFERFKVTFQNVFGKKETYEIGEKELGKFFDVYKYQPNKIIFAMEIAMQKLVTQHPTKKSIFSRLRKLNKKNFEYNIPSNFMKMFTGKKPISIAEKHFNINLKGYKKEVLALLKKMSETPNNNYSFIAGTGVKKLERYWHCFVVESVDYKNQIIYLKNKRSNIPKAVSFDEAFDKLKYFVGYFEENLK
jgi:hypothetical protein